MHLFEFGSTSKNPSSKNTYKTTCKLLKNEIFDDYRQQDMS